MQQTGVLSVCCTEEIYVDRTRPATPTDRKQAKQPPALAMCPGSPELSKSYMDMASKLFTFTFTWMRMRERLQAVLNGKKHVHGKHAAEATASCSPSTHSCR